jgi:hypothetical protein
VCHKVTQKASEGTARNIGEENFKKIDRIPLFFDKEFFDLYRAPQQLSACYLDGVQGLSR